MSGTRTYEVPTSGCQRVVRGGPRVPLPDKAKRLFQAPVLAVLSTISPGGQPHSSPLWVKRDGDALLFSIAAHRLKVRYLKRNPRVSVLACDPADPSSYAEVRGVATMTEAGAMELIEELSRAYQGCSWVTRPDEVRVLVRVTPAKVFTRSSGDR